MNIVFRLEDWVDSNPLSITIETLYVVHSLRKRKMGTFFGRVNEMNDLGVVAEHCPHCDRLRSCLLRTVRRGNYICFVKIAELSRESSCMCTDCLKTFPGKPHWSYAEVVPIREARETGIDDLLAKTNPILADRIHFNEQIRELGGDERFVVAYENIEGMRPGRLREDLLRRLLDWPRLGEAQRAELAQHIGALSRAWQFAREMAIRFPTSPAASAYTIAIMAGLVLFCVPLPHRWLWGTIAVGVGLIATLIAEHHLLRRSVSRWTLQVLIPEAQEMRVPLDRFVSVVDDIPGCKLGLTEDLWPMKDQLQNICETLIAVGKLQRTPPQCSDSNTMHTKGS
jgi:hypothetical protein